MNFSRTARRSNASAPLAGFGVKTALRCVCGGIDDAVLDRHYGQVVVRPAACHPLERSQLLAAQSETLGELPQRWHAVPLQIALAKRLRSRRRLLRPALETSGAVGLGSIRCRKRRSGLRGAQEKGRADRKSAIRGDPEIGCNVLNDPFFLEERDWIPIPPDWAKNIVRGRSYDDEEAEGAAFLQAVLAGARSSAVAEVILDEPPRYGADYLARARLGQGAFRVLVTEAYGRRCAITGEKTLPVLDAAHIKSYAELGPNQVANGILLRSDLHRLLDSGYITVTPELKVEVSNRLKADFENGREYYRFHGADLTVCPSELRERPSPAFLQWHNETKFLG